MTEMRNKIWKIIKVYIPRENSGIFRQECAFHGQEYVGQLANSSVGSLWIMWMKADAQKIIRANLETLVTHGKHPSLI